MTMTTCPRCGLLVPVPCPICGIECYDSPGTLPELAGLRQTIHEAGCVKRSLAADYAAIRAWHVEGPGGMCRKCSYAWPCEFIRYVEAHEKELTT